MGPKLLVGGDPLACQLTLSFLYSLRRSRLRSRARLASPGEHVDHDASKGAIDTVTIVLAREVAGEGIRVNGVRPAYTYTEIHASGGEPNRVDRVKDFVPLKRGGQPGEGAYAILWLLPDEASFSTGTFIDVTGGK